uniref:uncharacterized protein LOC117606586 isoform X1 n=1 Tax=Osmia lignaria TaxID=473952 RepID=UPI001479608B|nr:uncharacterized protein LOC117606586 isoform X1 [Osmia lignaria]XP_034185129.1 uncharacterized protein LOC117606586 isoform X1 [Osmia lignaria]XP_034185130.1 uncharacterized protein LOC117606586 isoform X1 [Osmia lignaria]XP_034185131.1 uncharacterized protein LOC117606586 isoform X1 [Osmia lignaria]XP_034185132.1 uncharacterized protein LOC117606586 isoform X1 [Osmia lignaria]XP_034185133.1 uncharacterized protein LOC117606586 isoform X1 [Osmia lignaria]XP_034185134.1 uncharacterized prot
MKFNKYQYSSCIDPNRTNSSLKEHPDMKLSCYYQLPNQNFFKCFCTSICSATKRLDMKGSVISEKIRRHFQDTDIPALLIFLKKHPDIIHINLANNDISDTGFMNLLDHVLLYKSVENLDLQNNNITEKGTNYLLARAEYLEIKYLNLKANKFGVQASKNVATYLLKNKHIVALNVAEVDQSASSLIYFVMGLSSEQEISNNTLRDLDISRPNPGFMYYFDSVHFADVIGHMLKNNTCLRALHLQKYNFSCHDIENMMSNAKYNNTLYLLDLGNNNIGDHGVEHITSWLIKRPALKTLILCRNIITDHGARSLSFTLPFSKILVLDISYNKMTDNGIVDILNTLKKSPLLRQLRIFGNCIGHPAAKIIKRMLMFQVLEQENIDVRPYRVDHKWYFARYEGSRCKKEYHDIPYGLHFNAPRPPTKINRPNMKYYKYTYTKTTELKVQHSIITIISRILSRQHVQDCKCCYCIKCEAPHFDELCRDANHPEDCTCCKCKADSEISIDKSIIDRLVPVIDVMKSISYILKRVNCEVQDKIVRWVNINEDILEEDLETIACNREDVKTSSEDTVLCNTSWVQLNMPTLQKYLQQTSSKNVLIVPKNYLVYSNSADEMSSLQYCPNKSM